MTEAGVAAEIGDVEVLQVVFLPTPIGGSGQVQVRVEVVAGSRGTFRLQLGGLHRRRSFLFADGWHC